jgi:ribosome biogenesis GTPase / thiamine phosphate phosphatase
MSRGLGMLVKKQSTAAAQQTMQRGLVVATHGRHCVVQTPAEPDGARRICHPRGKKSQVLVGDWVQWQASTDEGTIEQVETRRNEFYRQDELRTKAFAANLDQIVILIAAEPEFSEKQLARALIAAEQQHIKPLIVLNKSDLTQAFDRAWQRLLSYQRMGYTLMPLCLLAAKNANSVTESHSLKALQNQLQGKTTLVLGPSGSGKSTLVNALVEGAQVMTGEISQALNSGKHTTTSTTLYWLNQGSALIDSPGFQEFGLQHIAAPDLAAYMPDLKAHMGQCRFYNCSHLHEPGCGVRAHLQDDASANSREASATPEALESSGPETSRAQITASRYRIYQELFAELSAPARY